MASIGFIAVRRDGGLSPMMTTQEFIADTSPRAGFWRVRAKAGLLNQTRQEIAVVTPPPPQGRDGDLSSPDPVVVPAIKPSKSDKNARNEAIVEAYLAGELLKAITEKYQVSDGTVYYVLAKAGLSPKRQERSEIEDQVKATPETPPSPEPAAETARVAATVSVTRKTADTGAMNLGEIEGNEDENRQSAAVPNGGRVSGAFGSDPHRAPRGDRELDAGVCKDSRHLVYPGDGLHADDSRRDGHESRSVTVEPVAPAPQPAEKSKFRSWVEDYVKPEERIDPKAIRAATARRDRPIHVAGISKNTKGYATIVRNLEEKAAAEKHRQTDTFELAKSFLQKRGPVFSATHRDGPAGEWFVDGQRGFLTNAQVIDLATRKGWKG